MSVEKLVEYFSALEDPRCAGKVDHRLIDILVIAVCAVKSAVDERCHLKIRVAEVRIANVWPGLRHACSPIKDFYQGVIA